MSTNTNCAFVAPGEPPPSPEDVTGMWQWVKAGKLLRAGALGVVLGQFMRASAMIYELMAARARLASRVVLLCSYATKCATAYSAVSSPNNGSHSAITV